MPRPALLLASALLCLSSATAQNDAPLDLKLHWEPGQTYLQESDTDTTNYLTAFGKSSDQNLRFRQTTRISVQKSAQGQTEARVVIDHLLGEMSYEGKTHTFDSKSPATSHPALQRIMGGTAGRRFTLLYDDRDNFLDAKDTASMVTGGAEPDLVSIANARQFAILYRRSLEMGLPKIPVLPGDKWVSEEQISFPQAGNIKVRLNAKFDGVVDREGRRQAQIAFEGSMKNQPDKDSTGRDLDTERLVTLGDDSKVNGHIFFDLERKTISLAVFSATLQIKIEGRTMPMRQQVTTRLVSMKPTPAQ